MNTEKPYTITYKYTFTFNNRLLAFRKKELFDVTETPKHIPFIGHWNINRKQLSLSKAKELTTNSPVTIDVSHLQWYLQVELDECLNLERHK